MKNYSFLVFYAILLLFSCNKEEKVKPNLHNKGEITLQYDDSFVNIAEALSNNYMQAYPNTKINLEVVKEDQALLNLLNHKVDLIIMSRDLNEKERKYWETKTKMPWKPAYFAGDAVVFISSKKSSRESISLYEIKEMMMSDEKPLIFDGANTSNFNTVVQKLNLDEKEVKYSRIEGNENIAESLSKFPNHIGVISYNTISRPQGEKVQKLRESVKILPINHKNELISASKESIKSQKYPLVKLLYFLTDEGSFGLANGFIKYSSTNIGQKIVKREGLQPYYIFPRTVKINNK